MTLTDHDLSALLAALKAGEITETVRTGLEWILQALIEAGATAVIGPPARAHGEPHDAAQRPSASPVLDGSR